MIGLFKITRTTDAMWILPTRIVIGILLVFPIEGETTFLLTYCKDYTFDSMINDRAGGNCTILHSVEFLLAIAFLFGFLLRILALPALLIFGLRAISNVGNSVFIKGGTLLGFIQLHGDWVYGVLYIATFFFLNDIMREGSGRWSIDDWLSRTLTNSK
jgi:hypothetical protein